MKILPLILTSSLLLATPCTYAATLTFGTTAPTPAGSAAISNWIGATFDAANVGGSGVNASGGANNGAANDGTTYVATNRPAQGETFTTGPNPGGYTITAITLRMPGYSNNIASGSNIGGYGLSSTSSTFTVRVGQISGTTFIPYTIEYAASGGTGTPGTGSTANGPGTYLTFTFKAPIVLQPNTVYAFDIGTSGDYFETLGISTSANGGTNPYSGGTAYTSGASGVAAGGITTQAGNRVFMVDMAPYTPPAPGTFVHPGLLNTAADFVRMRNNVALGVEPWLSNYNALKSSWMANAGWPSHAQATITRGSINDSSRLYNDIAVAYSCALVWKISGDTAYADEAVRILNAWGYTFTGLAGDTNIALNELYGCQFAAVAEIMRTYPGWAPADLAQFQTMIYNVFFPVADSFLTSHFGTGDSHYWANWDLASMSTLYAIGVLNDNATLTTRSTNYFYGGVGNGCIDRAVNFIHPGYLGQGQEMGRDQGHATLDIAQLAAYCQMAWNQGTDLFGYENNRVLAMAEYTAKYNNGNDVPWTNYGYDYYWPTVWLQTSVSSGSRGPSDRPGWPTLYNHYVNLMGLSAPNVKQTADNMGTGWGFNGDSLGWDQLTTALPPIASGANPSSPSAVLHGQQPCLSWWGSAYATSYNVKRSTTSGGPYTTIATGVATNTYTDTNPVAGVTNYYVVTGSLSGGGETGVSNETAVILGVPLLAQLNLDETSGTTAADSTGNGWTGTLVNGATWTAGKNGNAVNLAKASSQYVSLPAGIVADVSDLTVSAWVYQNSASNNARIFDFGSGDNFYGGWSPWNYPTWLAERYMYLAPQDGSGKVRFGISRSTSVGEESILGASALPTGQWVHVIVTLNAGVGTLYVNGMAVGQNLNMPMTPMQFPPTTQNYIGKSQSRGDPYFDGKIDDFRIYRGALTTGQAYTLATGLAPATPPATAPANLAVTALVGNQNSLSWAATAGATSYTVLRATSAGGPYTIVASIVPGTTYTDTGLTAGTTYYYEVDGANSGGDGAVSSASTGVVALPPMPSVPSGFTAVASTSTAVALNWTAAANAYTYNVKRSLVSGGPYTTIASGVTATTYSDTGLTTGTTYYYAVSSVNTAGESANSTPVSATPSDLLVHLRFDETYGSSSADASGNGWNATLVNAPSWTAGIFGNALNFTSASTQYGSLATGIVSTVNDFTISVWVNPTSLATWARVYDFGTGTTNYMFLTVQGGAGAGKPRFAIRTPSVAEQVVDSSVAIPIGTWTQIVVTHTGTTGKMYINGALVGTNSAMTLTPSSLGSTTQNYFGHSQFGSDPYLNGIVDDFRLNSHAFTDAQIAANANPPPNVPANLSANPADGLISLSWAISDTATTYNVKRATVSGGPYTTVGSGLTTPTFVDTGLTDGTTYYYVVSAVNRLGESANSAETAGTPYSIAWAAQDIGTVSPAGSSSVSGGTVTMSGSGADIWGTADAFQFRSVPVTGNCVITARVWSVTNTNAWSKAGVMIRDSLAPNAMNAFLFVSPTTTNGIQWQNRNTTGGTTAAVDVTGITAPYWVRLVRTGTTIQGYRSPDGVNWTAQGSATLASLSSTAYVGLAVTSHLAGSLCTAVFDNVSVNWVPDLPSAVTATPGPEQVALSWSTVPNATSYNVYVSNVSGGPYAPLATGLTSPSYVQTGFSSGATQYYVVTAQNIASEGLDSGQVNAAPIFPPTAPTGPAATGGTGQVSLSWTASIGTTSYNIYRSTTSGGPYGTAIGSSTTTSYVDTTAASGTAYYYVVTGVDAAGEGVVSTEVNAITAPGAVTGVTALAGNGQVALNWTALAGAATYSVGRSTVSGGPYTIIASGGTTTGYLDSGLANGTSYYYVVIAVNTGGTGPNSAEVGGQPMPPLPVAPSGLAATAGNGQVALTWSATTYATSYVVGRSTTNGGPYTPVASPTGTSYTDTGLTNGTTYYYAVSAVDLSGNGPSSTQASAEPLPPLPVAPTGLTATAGNAQVALTWSATTYATSYVVGRSTTNGGPYTTVASPTGITYTDTGLTNGTTYYYVIAAVDLAGTGPNSSQASAEPLPPLPVAPTTLTATAGNGQVSLSWNAATYATSYNVKRSTTAGGPYTTVASPTGTSAVDSGLTNGTTYYYVVTTIDLAGESGNSSEVNAQPLPPIPTAPTGFAAVAGNAQVSLSWNAATYATSYNVKRSTTAGGPYTTVASPTGTSAVDSGLTNGTTYYYVVTTIDLAGESGNSSEVNAQPLPPIPTAPTGFAAVAGNAQVSLSWNAATYATSYNVKRSTTAGGPYTTVASPTGTSAVDSGLTNGTTYYYVVTTVDLAGESANSSEVNAAPVSPLPGIVTGLAAGANSDQVALSWTAVTGATSYTIARSTTSGGPYATVASGVTAISSTDAGLVNGTTYYYVVAAVNASGTGPNSTQVFATPAAQNLFWDTTTAAGLANGSGAWDTNVTAKWSNSSAGTSNPLLTWLNDDNAFFQTAGTLTATIATGATVQLGSLTQAVSGTASTITGGTLQFNSNAGIVEATGGNHSLVINSAIVLNSPNVTLDDEVTSGSLALNGVISEIGGSRALTKTGTGTVSLGNVANTFSGGVTLSAKGQVAFSNNASFGTGPITFNAGTSLTSTAQIYTASTTTVTGLANNIAVTPGSFGAYTGGRALVFSGNLLAGPGTFYIAATISATSVTLTGDNHAFNGVLVYKDNGTTTLLLGSSTAGSSTATWTLTGGSTKGLGANLAGANTFLLGELSSASGIGRLFNNQATGTATFQLGDATTTAPSFGGIIADGSAGGNVALTKTGTDNQVLTGASTYTGATAITGGTLTVNGSLAAGSSVTINSGATLAGKGKINGTATLANGGIVAPGGSGTAGTLSFAGEFNLSNGGILNYDLATTTTSDKIALTGAYIASGTVTINLNALSGFGAGTYSLITGATGISAGNFALGAAPSGHTYQLSASGTTLSLIVGNAPAAPTGLAAVAANTEVDLAWSASTGATSYSVQRSTTSGGPYASVATGLTVTSYADKSLTNGTTYYYVVTATNTAGTSANSTPASATPEATYVDSYWLDNDIGAVGQAGSSSYSSGTFTLNGSGTGVTGAVDSLDYTYQTLTGDGTIIARVATGSGASGVMMRETLDASARVVDLLLQTGTGAVFQDRVATGGSAVNGAATASLAAPYWVKLARAGNIFTGSTSPDGVTWTQVGTIYDTLASTIYVGLAQSSLNNATLAAATFTNVSIVPAAAWASQDIGTVPIVGASYYSNGVATVQGTGASLYNGSDQFRYTYLAASGDCDITARVASESKSNASAKAGVMIRASLAANSAYAMADITPTSGLAFQYRTATGGNSASTTVTGLKAPYWVRLVRSGNTFTAYRSPDGTTWTTIGTQTITMPTAVYIGLPVCSYSTTTPCTATFDNIITNP